MALLTWDTDINGNLYNSNPGRTWLSELYQDSTSQASLFGDIGGVLSVFNEPIVMASVFTDTALAGYIKEADSIEDFFAFDSLAYGFIGVWDEGIAGFFPVQEAICSPLCCEWVEDDAAKGCPGV